MFAAKDQQRILHLVSNSRWTGVAEPAASLAKFQSDSGCDVRMACIWGRSMQEELIKRNFQLASELRLDRRMNPLNTLQDVRRLRKYLKFNAISVVHTHQLHEHWLAALALRGWKGSPRPLLVRTVHRFETMRNDPWHSWLFSKATDLITTVSTEQQDQLKAAYPAARANIEVIFGGVDPAKFQSNPESGATIRADMGEKPGAVVGGIVAHLGYNRGHKWLLKAAPKALEQSPNGVIWIIGQGEMRKELRRACQDTRYHHRMVMAGYRSDDLPETYSALNFALLLGLGSEGSARAALEAMAAGKPVIAINRGALRDTITHGTDGFLLEENDVDGLTKYLTELMNNPDLCRKMGEAAREKVLARFTEQKRFEATSLAYQRALKAR